MEQQTKDMARWHGLLSRIFMGKNTLGITTGKGGKHNGGKRFKSSTNFIRKDRAKKNRLSKISYQLRKLNRQRAA